MDIFDEFDSAAICTSVNSNTITNVTVESVLATCRKTKELAPRLRFDCLVCLPQHFERLKKEAQPFDREPAILDHLASISIYVEPTELEVMAKALDLMHTGQRVAVVLKDGTVLELPTLLRSVHKDKELNAISEAELTNWTPNCLRR